MFCRGVVETFAELIDDVAQANAAWEVEYKKQGWKADQSGRGPFSWRGRMETFVMSTYPDRFTSFHRYELAKVFMNELSKSLEGDFRNMMRLEVKHSDPRLSFDVLIGNLHAVPYSIHLDIFGLCRAQVKTN